MTQLQKLSETFEISTLSCDDKLKIDYLTCYGHCVTQLCFSSTEFPKHFCDASSFNTTFGSKRKVMSFKCKTNKT